MSVKYQTAGASKSLRMNLFDRSRILCYSFSILDFVDKICNGSKSPFQTKRFSITLDVPHISSKMRNPRSIEINLFHGTHVRHIVSAISSTRQTDMGTGNRRSERDPK